MLVYLVELIDQDDRVQNILINNNSELSKILDNLDKDKYRIKGVKAIDNFYTDYLSFCKKEKNLETGKEID